jgi:hypothetical protein
MERRKRETEIETGTEGACIRIFTHACVCVCWGGVCVHVVCVPVLQQCCASAGGPATAAKRPNLVVEVAAAEAVLVVAVGVAVGDGDLPFRLPRRDPRVCRVSPPPPFTICAQSAPGSTAATLFCVVVDVFRDRFEEHRFISARSRE